MCVCVYDRCCIILHPPHHTSSSTTLTLSLSLSASLLSSSSSSFLWLLLHLSLPPPHSPLYTPYFIYSRPHSLSALLPWMHRTVHRGVVLPHFILTLNAVHHSVIRSDRLDRERTFTQSHVSSLTLRFEPGLILTSLYTATFTVYVLEHIRK